MEDLTSSSTVRTGDVIRLTLVSKYAFGDSFQATGAVLKQSGSGYRDYFVNKVLIGGKSDVSFSDAVLSEFTVTVTVEFDIKGDTPEEQPSGNIAVNAQSASVPVDSGVWNQTDGSMTYTFEATRQVYTVTASFLGYSEGKANVQVTEDTNVTIECNAVVQTVVFMYKDQTLLTVDNWYVEDARTLDDLYTDTEEGYVAWTDGNILLHGSDKLVISMFQDGKLILQGLPEVSDITPGDEVSVVMVTESQLGLGVELEAEGYDSVSVVSDLDVIATLYGGDITLKSSGAPGTGSFHVILDGDGGRLILHVIVVETVEDIGGTGMFLMI